MFQVIRNNAKTLILIFVLASLGVTNVALMRSSELAQEQKQKSNMRELLEAARIMIEESEVPFTVTFKFAQPLMANDENFWELPYLSEEEDIDRWIGEVGDDFVCFYERGGSSYLVRCTPFSNIVSFSYLNP